MTSLCYGDLFQETALETDGRFLVVSPLPACRLSGVVGALEISVRFSERGMILLQTRGARGTWQTPRDGCSAPQVALLCGQGSRAESSRRLSAWNLWAQKGRGRKGGREGPRESRTMKQDEVWGVTASRSPAQRIMAAALLGRPPPSTPPWKDSTAAWPRGPVAGRAGA